MTLEEYLEVLRDAESKMKAAEISHKQLELSTQGNHEQAERMQHECEGLTRHYHYLQEQGQALEVAQSEARQSLVEARSRKKDSDDPWDMNEYLTRISDVQKELLTISDKLMSNKNDIIKVQDRIIFNYRHLVELRTNHVSNIEKLQASVESLLSLRKECLEAKEIHRRQMNRLYRIALVVGTSLESQSVV